MMIRFFSAFLILGAFLMAPTPSMANLNAVTPSPASRTIAITNSSPVAITWGVRRIGGGTSLFESDDANLTLGIGGPVLTTINRGFSRSVTDSVFANFTLARFTETLNIAPRYIRQAAEAGVPLVFEREWTDTAFVQSVTGQVIISVGGASSAEFTIPRVEMSFDDNSSYRTVEMGDAMTAVAHVKATGSGLLRGSWQVRDANGSGNFRTLRTFSQRIASQQNVNIISPRLPTFKEGRVDVRLKIEEPDVSFDLPVISYQVMQENAVVDKASVRAQLLAPRPGEPISADTVIRWREVPGAKSYKVEVYGLDDDDTANPKAVMLVRANRQAIKPSPVMLENLSDGGKYRVVVRGIE